MKLKKELAVAVAAVLMMSAAAGCTEKTKEKEGKINISVGDWPDETQAAALEARNKMAETFMAANQNINLIPDTYKYDTKTFTMKASAGQLPTMYKSWFTEINQIIDAGYAADITEQMKAHGFDTAMNPSLLELVTSEDGKIYGIPVEAYAQGLHINKKLFQEAGLVNDDGSIKVPDTYQEMAEFAQIIKEKTGKAGFIMPTTNNGGGWHFLNIAWSFGVEFMKQRDDGSWEATFDTKEARDALQYIKDLKWKYKVLMDESVLTQEDIYKYFATYQAAMMFADPPRNQLTQKYGMDIDDIFVTRMPEGPAGRYSQMGGGLWFFSQAASPEEIDAGMKWLEFTGVSADVTDQQLTNLKTSYQQTIDNKGVVLDQDAFDIWVKPDSLEKIRAVKAEYANVKHENYEQYYNFNGVTINPEPGACAQQLYAVLDGCIQEVLTNENADVDVLIKTANSDFQVNHLDKMD